MIDTVAGLATIPAILAVVNLAKQFGVTGKWSALLAVVLGLIFKVLDYSFVNWGYWDAAGWYGSLVVGAVLGLSAAGLYDVAVTIGNTGTSSGDTTEYADDVEKRVAD